MKPERWRLFVAVPIGDELRRDLAAAVEEWKNWPDLAGLRWTDPESWHVTLAFLGSVDVTAVAEVRAQLEAAARSHPPMRLPTGGLGAFPSGARARIAWYGVADPGRRLAALAADVRSGRAQHDDSFRAHVTVGRARRQAVDLRAWAAQAGAPEGQLAVNDLKLMRSHLGGNKPARYEPVASADLG